MEKKKKRSAFGKPRPNDQLVRTSPPLLHIPAYSAGGLKQLYNNIKDRKHDWIKAYGLYTDEHGEFVPQSGLPLLAGRYQYMEILGKGQSSVLIKALDTFIPGVAVSIKILHTHYHELGTQEMDCIRKLNLADPEGFSPTIRLQNTFTYDGHFCMVFELLNPRSLISHFSKITCKHKKLQAIRKVTVCLLQALGFLQQQNVIHADLKPENILMVDGVDYRRLKVVDLGNAIHCIHEELSLYYDDFELQTLLYRAPEVMYGLPFGLEVDLWSLGCILSELYMGKPLFHGTDQQHILKKMVQILGPIPQSFQRGKFFNNFKSFAGSTSNQDVSLTLMMKLGTNDYNFADFLRGLLQYDPANRLTILEAAQHPFLAPELALRFLLTDLHDSDKTSGYRNVLLTKDVYQHSPVVSDEVTKCHMSSLDLLRHGTKISTNQSLNSSQNIHKKVAQIVPTMRVPTPGPSGPIFTNNVHNISRHVDPVTVSVKLFMDVEHENPLRTQTTGMNTVGTSDINSMQHNQESMHRSDDISTPVTSRQSSCKQYNTMVVNSASSCAIRSHDKLASSRSPVAASVHFCQNESPAASQCHTLPSSTSILSMQSSTLHACQTANNIREAQTTVTNSESSHVSPRHLTGLDILTGLKHSSEICDSLEMANRLSDNLNEFRVMSHTQKVPSSSNLLAHNAGQPKYLLASYSKSSKDFSKATSHKDCKETQGSSQPFMQERKQFNLKTGLLSRPRKRPQCSSDSRNNHSDNIQHFASEFDQCLKNNPRSTTFKPILNSLITHHDVRQIECKDSDISENSVMLSSGAACDESDLVISESNNQDLPVQHQNRYGQDVVASMKDQYYALKGEIGQVKSEAESIAGQPVKAGSRLKTMETEQVKAKCDQLQAQIGTKLPKNERVQYQGQVASGPPGPIMNQTRSSPAKCMPSTINDTVCMTGENSDTHGELHIHHISTKWERLPDETVYELDTEEEDNYKIALGECLDDKSPSSQKPNSPRIITSTNNLLSKSKKSSSSCDLEIYLKNELKENKLKINTSVVPGDSKSDGVTEKYQLNYEKPMCTSNVRMKIKDMVMSDSFSGFGKKTKHLGKITKSASNNKYTDMQGNNGASQTSGHKLMSGQKSSVTHKSLLNQRHKFVSSQRESASMLQEGLSKYLSCQKSPESKRHADVQTHDGDSSPDYTVNLLHYSPLTVSNPFDDIVITDDNQSELKFTLPKETNSIPPKPDLSHKQKNVQIDKGQTSALHYRAKSAGTHQLGNANIAKMLKQIGMFCETVPSLQTHSNTNKRSVTNTKRKTPSENTIFERQKKIVRQSPEIVENEVTSCSVVHLMHTFGKNTKTVSISKNKIKPESQATQNRCSSDDVVNVEPNKLSTYQSAATKERSNPTPGYESGACSRSKVNTNRKPNWQTRSNRKKRQVQQLSRQTGQTIHGPDARPQKVVSPAEQMDVLHIVDDVLLL